MIGPRWWLLPLAGLVPLATFVAWFEFATFGSPHFRVGVQVACEGSSYGALITVAAVLNQYGARPRHRVASALTIAFAELILSPITGPPGCWIIILVALGLLQLTVVRLIGLPRWYIAPHTEGSGAVSLSFLLTITAAAAVVAAVVARSNDLLDRSLWQFMFLVLVASLFGQVISAFYSRRWSVLGGGAGGGAILGLVAVDYTAVLDFTIWESAVVLTSAYVSSWAIGFLHRCEPKRTGIAEELATAT